jgi:hypothetical protein
LVKIEVDVPQPIATFLEEICLGSKRYIEMNLAGWVASSIDACDDLDAWFNVDIKAICKYLVDVGAGNDIIRDRAGLQKESLGV